MTFKVEERENEEEKEEKHVGENIRVGFKEKLDDENLDGTCDEVVGYRVGGSFQENVTKSTGGRSNGIEEEEVGYSLGGSFEEKWEGEYARVSKGGSSNGIEEELVGYRVAGRQGEGAGRFLLAAKTFQPGQPVLREAPLVQVHPSIFEYVYNFYYISGAKSTSWWTPCLCRMLLALQCQ